MTNREQLLKALEEAGVPDEVRRGMFKVGNIRSQVADMLIQAVKERGRAKVLLSFQTALTLAERETPKASAPPAPKSEPNRGR